MPNCQEALAGFVEVFSKINPFDGRQGPRQGILVAVFVENGDDTAMVAVGLVECETKTSVGAAFRLRGIWGLAQEFNDLATGFAWALVFYGVE